MLDNSFKLKCLWKNIPQKPIHVKPWNVFIRGEQFNQKQQQQQ